jgi:hypothetical protein
VVSDGLDCFTAVTKAGCTHQPIVTGSGRTSARHPAFKWVNTGLGTIKATITGIDRAVRDKHVPRYLAEYTYRFKRRYDLASMPLHESSRSLHRWRNGWSSAPQPEPAEGRADPVKRGGGVMRAPPRSVTPLIEQPVADSGESGVE